MAITDVQDLFLSCRLGDMERVRYLIEGRKVDLNVRDDHDSSPLYYAALCGHTKICRYLLQKGAYCPEEDGDRRIYHVARTEGLQQLLRDYSSGKTRIMVDPFTDILKKAFADDTFADWELVVNVSEGAALRLPLHSAVVGVRCPVLAAAAAAAAASQYNIQGSNDDGRRLEICLSSLESSYHAATIRTVVEYLYTGMIESRSDTDSTIISELILVSTLLGLNELCQAMRDASNHKRRSIIIDHRQQLRADMGRLSDFVLANQCESHSTAHSSLLDDLVMHSSDAVLCSQQDDTRFPVHRFILCGHGEYFCRALLGSFREANTGVLSLPASGRAVASACEWMYTDQWKEIPEPALCVELIQLADHLMLPRLASLAATLLVPSVNVDNAWDLLSLSRLYSLEKLEACCLRVIALCIEEMMEASETKDALRALIREEISGTTQSMGGADFQDIPLVTDMKKVITDHFEYLGEDDDSESLERESSRANSTPKLRTKQSNKLKLLQDMLEDVSRQTSRRD